MTTWLKQSTATDVELGPFVDDADGKTPETGLTISQADCQLIKNGGAAAQKNDATSASHLAGGHYKVPLNTTDTNTLGRLRLYVNEGGALPVWRDFMVLPANTYDSLVGGSDYLQVDAAQWLGAALPASDTAGYPKVTVKSGTGTGEVSLSGGRANANVTYWNSTAVATPDTAGYPKVTIKDGTGTGEIDLTSGGVAANVTQWAGAAVATPDTAGYPKVTIKDGTGTGEIDLTAGAVATNISQIGGSAAAATNAGRAFQGIVLGTAVTGTLTTTVFTTSLTEATNDHYNGRTLTFTSGALAGQMTTITDYNGTSKAVTVTALTEAPANADEFFIA